MINETEITNEKKSNNFQDLKEWKLECIMHESFNDSDTHYEIDKTQRKFTKNYGAAILRASNLQDWVNGTPSESYDICFLANIGKYDSQPKNKSDDLLCCVESNAFEQKRIRLTDLVETDDSVKIDYQVHEPEHVGFMGSRVKESDKQYSKQYKTEPETVYRIKPINEVN